MQGVIVSAGLYCILSNFDKTEGGFRPPFCLFLKITLAGSGSIVEDRTVYFSED
jgi:hypothetical protein